MVTLYWLYYGARVLTCIRADGAISEQSVIRQALEAHDRNPTIGLEQYEAPLEYRIKIANASVVPQHIR